MAGACGALSWRAERNAAWSVCCQRGLCAASWLHVRCALFLLRDKRPLLFQTPTLLRETKRYGASDFEPKESWVRILCRPFLSCPGKKEHNMGQVGTASSSLSGTAVTKPALAHTSCPQCNFPNHCAWPVRGTGRPRSESWLYSFLLCDFEPSTSLL